MANYEFTRLADVAEVASLNNNANVLVEQDGEIGKVAKNQIGTQADWNETDETSPAYILNKPVIKEPETRTAIIKDATYDTFVDFMYRFSENPESVTPDQLPPVGNFSEGTFSCVNMTFEEAAKIISEGNVLQIICLGGAGGTCHAIWMMYEPTPNDAGSHGLIRFEVKTPEGQLGMFEWSRSGLVFTLSD